MFYLCSIIFVCLQLVTTGSASLSIIDEPECTEVKAICHNLSEKEDLLILECLQSLTPVQQKRINKDCQNVIWRHTAELMGKYKVAQLINPYCAKDAKEVNCDPQQDTYLKCMLHHRDGVTTDNCKTILARLEGVVFQDFRITQAFIKECSSEIERLKCGRLDPVTSTTSEVLACLQSNLVGLDEKCKLEVFMMTEIQADNIRFDKQLYAACQDDHLRYCAQEEVGSGRVFSCLIRQLKQEPQSISVACHNNILRREKLISRDYKVSKGLMRACRDDIKKSKCRKKTSSNNTNIRLAQILLCLEGVKKNGSNSLDQDCEREMIDHRKMLMEDFRLTPEIVDGCKMELKKYCFGFQAGGKTIHCLMEHARASRHPSKRIGDTCQRALETLVKQTDVGEDWRVDPELHQACYPVVQSACKGVRGGDARVMSCLLDNIGTDYMNEECEDALMQIQYFVARDFTLDPQLYRACKDHAVNICHAGQSWDEIQPSYNPQVLPCLYRYAYHDDNTLKLDKPCLQEVRRVMRQRAQSVDLQPEIEEPCLNDLSDFCHDKTKKGEEMLCLQNNLDHLATECRKAVESFTEIEAEHAELNPYVMSHCRKEMDALCSNEMKHDEGDVMECLISHKNDPLMKSKPACRASVEHFQIISLKNYKFTYKFKAACKMHALRFCSSVKTRSEVIRCLSERVLNDTIRGEKSVIPKECRQQIKSQLFQQRENIDFDPKLKQACESDISLYCGNIEHGSAQVLECLQSVQKRLSDACEKEVFKVKKQEIMTNSVDYALVTMCAGAISLFCPTYEKDNILECLKKYRDERGFPKKCRQIVQHRMVEQNANYQLNPYLQENCLIDIQKYCSKIAPPPHQNSKLVNDITGPVVKCLKTQFKLSRLTNKCGKELANIIKVEALDINLNPLLRVVCKNEISTVCKIGEVENVEECLKKALLEKRLATPECENEIANVIEESQADIEADPLLQQTCSLDLLTFCADVSRGNGRQIQCLKSVPSHKLRKLCQEMLNKRVEMYKSAAQIAPKDLQELYVQLVASPSRNYFFLTLLSVFGALFMVGILCGRVTKRHMLLKNK